MLKHTNMDVCPIAHTFSFVRKFDLSTPPCAVITFSSAVSTAFRSMQSIHRVCGGHEIITQNESAIISSRLPVKVAEERSLEAQDDGPARRWGTMEIQLAKRTVRIAGAVDVVALRATIECLVA
jgi:hypothetical protein